MQVGFNGFDFKRGSGKVWATCMYVQIFRPLKKITVAWNDSGKTRSLQSHDMMAKSKNRIVNHHKVVFIIIIIINYILYIYIVYLHKNQIQYR